MGGNVTAVIKKTGELTSAEKIDLTKTGRKEFLDRFIMLFKEINKQYYKKHKQKIWVDESKLVSGELFNGSTSFIFDRGISDDEILKYKSSAGDLDIIVPEEMKENIWNLLDSMEGKEVVKGIIYMGSNKPTVSSIGEQINGLFKAEFKDYTALAQVDFEFLPVHLETGTPSTWAKFSHSSSFEDAKKGVKAVHHKFLIQALVGGASARDDIVIATKSSTPEKFKISQAKGLDIPRMLKFSVARGIRTAYEPLIDPTTGKIMVDPETGKEIYKETDSKNADYATTAEEIYKLSFGDIDSHPEDVKLFWSFVGILDLMKKYMMKDKNAIKRTHQRYIEKLWAVKGAPGQVLEVGNPELDYQVKNSGYQYFCKTLGLTPDMKYAEAYYDNFSKLRGGAVKESNDDVVHGRIKSFKTFLTESLSVGQK